MPPSFKGEDIEGHHQLASRWAPRCEPGPHPALSLSRLFQHPESPRPIPLQNGWENNTVTLVLKAE